MQKTTLERLIHDSLRSLSVKDVRIDRDHETDQFVCSVRFLVNAEDEIGVFSALHTVVAATTEHLMRKHMGEKK